MLKRQAIIKFILTIIIAILGILLCVLPFNVPYSTKQYNGFIKAINKDIDLEGGLSAVYSCTLKEGNDGKLSQSIDESISTLESVFKEEKFRQLIIERQGGNKVNITTSSDAYEMNKAFYYITDGKALMFTTAQVSDTLKSPEVYLDSSDIDTAKINYDYDASQYGVEITLKESSQNRIDAIKSIAKATSAQNIYIYLGKVDTNNLFAEISYKDIDKDKLFLTASSSSQYSTSSAESTREITYNIIGGMLDINLNLLEVSPISLVLGKNTQLYIGICLLVTIFLTFVFMCIRYGDLGLLASLALIFFIVLFAFFMQAIPFINLTLSGVIGSIIAFLFAALSCAIIFENIKSEYAIGKKIHLSFKGGFKKSLWTLLDIHAILILASIFIWVLAPSLMKCFGITLILGSLLSAFTSLVILRALANDYIVLNSTKAGRLKLYRDPSAKDSMANKENSEKILEKETTYETNVNDESKEDAVEDEIKEDAVETEIIEEDEEGITESNTNEEIEVVENETVENETIDDQAAEVVVKTNVTENTTEEGDND